MELVARNIQDPNMHESQIKKIDRRLRPFPILLRFFVAILSTAPLIPLAASARFSPYKSLVWGPGLDAAFSVPSRFFFVQAVDVEGVNITTSLGKNFFSVRMLDDEGQPSRRVWTQLLDRQDGSYIVRFRLWQTSVNMRIEITDDKGVSVAGSPYWLKGPLYPENCFCPESETETWLSVMGCPASFSQIEKDFSHFSSKIDMGAVVDAAVSRFSDPHTPSGSHSICHYVVKDNRIYRRCYGQHVGFKMFPDATLLSLTGKVRLPDFEFVINLGDWPLEKRQGKDALPIVSWCGSDDTRDIILPTWDLTNSVLETQGRVTLDLLSVQSRGPNQSWEEKIEKGFFRGRDAREERLSLARRAKKRPDLLDVGITNYFFFRNGAEEELGRTESISFFDFFKFKYQINVDGTVAAYRLPFLLAGNSVVLKQESPYYEHFYTDLEPWVHYVPLKRDLTDVEEKIEYLKTHDELARNISAAGSAFVRSNLMSNQVFCYHYKVFTEFAARAKKAPRVRTGMEEVVRETNDPRSPACDCLTSKKKRKKSKKTEL